MNDAPIAIDVSGLIPEAQPIARQVAQLFWKHTQPWFVGLTCFGSGVKGGIIPGASDLDFHLYLEEEAFAAPGVLRLDVALAIQTELVTIDPAPFQYIDGGAELGRLPEGHIGPIPGNYSLIGGRLPLPEATNAELLEQARWSLARLTPLPAFVSENLLHHGKSRGQLSLTVRELCQLVWPVLYQVRCLEQGDGLGVWRLPKHELVALYAPDDPLGRAVHAFNDAVRAYYPTAQSPDDALRVIESAVAVRHAAAAWASDRDG